MGEGANWFEGPDLASPSLDSPPFTDLTDLAAGEGGVEWRPIESMILLITLWSNSSVCKISSPVEWSSKTKRFYFFHRKMSIKEIEDNCGKSMKTASLPTFDFESR